VAERVVRAAVPGHGHDLVDVEGLGVLRRDQADLLVHPQVIDRCTTLEHPSDVPGVTAAAGSRGGPPLTRILILSATRRIAYDQRKAQYPGPKGTKKVPLDSGPITPAYPSQNLALRGLLTISTGFRHAR
jgi:hypothetical protein